MRKGYSTPKNVLHNTPKNVLHYSINLGYMEHL